MLLNTHLKLVKCIENDNECSEYAMAVFSSSKEMVGHIKEPLAMFFH